jgi:hypothetical protein
MRCYLILILVQFLYISAMTQNEESFRINSVRRDSNEMFRSIYRYPQFSKGNILFNNQIQIQYISIDKDTFYYFEKDWIELVTH